MNTDGTQPWPDKVDHVAHCLAEVMSLRHTASVDTRLESVSPPMDAGRFVELRFRLAECDDAAGGGELRLRVEAADAPLWMVGDEYHMRMVRV